MTTYYCDASGTFSTAQTGANHTGDEWQGPYGLQKALDTVTAGNDLYIKGTANLTRLVSATLGDADGWSVGDEVQNDIGDGDDWTGILCEVSGNNVVIELDVGYTVGDIDTGDGIENTTSPDTTTIANPACDGVIVDTQSGSNASGVIKYIGVNSSWAIDGTQAIINGNGDATYCIDGTTGTCQYLWWQNVQFTNAVDSGLQITSSNMDEWILINCDIDSHGNDGFVGASGNNYMTFILSRIYNNTDNGVIIGNASRFILSSSYGNGTIGYNVGSSGNALIFASTIFDNGNSSINILFDTGTVILNSVIDGTGQTGETGIRPYDTNSEAVMVLMTRITNCATGLDAINGIVFHGWDLYHNNTSDTANAGTLYAIPDNDTADTNQYDPDADDGYNDASSKDYNLKSSRTYNGDGNDTIGLGVGS